MKTTRLNIVTLLALFSCLAAFADAPRVFMLDAKQLQVTRQHLRDGDAKLQPALDQLLRDAHKALDGRTFSIATKDGIPPSGDKHDYMSQAPYFWRNPDTTNGLPYVRHDGERNPELKKFPDHKTLDDMAGAVEALGLAYYFTGREEYATKAAELLRVFFIQPATRMNPNLNFGQAVPGVNNGRGNGLIETRGLVRVVDGVGLLAGSKAWADVDQHGLQDWFSQFLKWMQESKIGREEAAAKNNHGTFYDVQAVSFALFTGNQKLAENIVREAKAKRIAKQVEPDGRQPLETERTKGWGYSTANLSGLMSLAVLGENFNVDLWNYKTADSRSIRQALDYLIPFALENKKWPYQQIGEWPPQSLYPSLRLAAIKYPHSPYPALLSKIPSLETSNRQNLLLPRPPAPDSPPK